MSPAGLPTTPSAGDLAIDSGDANKLKFFDGSVWQNAIGGGAVLSVFGRTGAVTAQSGDYTAAQVTNAASTASANTFTAGSKQTFQASTTTAGARIAAAALPTTPAAGDLAIDSGDSNKLKFYDGGAWRDTDAVASVFGRLGAVTAQAGDYTAAQVTDAASTASANTFASGAKQIFQASGTTAGARIAAAALPSSPAAGDLAIDSGDSNKLKFYDGASWQDTLAGGGGGAVSSVFGRTGAVTAQAGDYTAAQVTNAASTASTNTFTAGAKQIFQASGATAGARIVAAALPSSPAAGDLAIDSGDSNKLKFYDGASWQDTLAGGGGGAVSSVFGRTGAVTAQSGDYSAAQVTNAASTASANTWTTGDQNMSAAASLRAPASAGFAPTIDGSIGYDSTQEKWVGGGNGLTGSFPRVLTVTRPVEALTNSTTAQQNFTSVFTIPANYLVTGKVLRVSILFEFATGSTAQSQRYALKLGSTTVFDQGAAQTPGANTTRNAWLEFLIVGTAAAGASVAVETSSVSPGNWPPATSSLGATAQPVNLATNGSLTIVPAITFGGTATTNTVTLRVAMVEELN